MNQQSSAIIVLVVDLEKVIVRLATSDKDFPERLEDAWLKASSFTVKANTDNMPPALKSKFDSIDAEVTKSNIDVHLVVSEIVTLFMRAIQAESVLSDQKQLKN